MASVYTVNVSGRDVVVVDCDPDDGVDSVEAKKQALVLKERTRAQAVLVQHGACFWVV